MRNIFTIISALVLFQSGVYAQTPGDFCTDPINATVGPNSFDTTNNTQTLPEPDESQCPDTYLNWTSSPDVWFKFVPTDSGVHNFTTCDATSFDTSMVLYESSCTLQVACNGDALTGSGCQPYHSAFEYSLTAQVPYYIRIGGFGGITGSGTLTIDPPAGSDVNIWYVDIDNPSPGSGSDWSSAFNTLQDALDSATGIDQIWIAEGFYKPTNTNNQKDPREASFRIHSSLEIYGGFQGDETTLSQRDYYRYKVFLSGDLYGDDDVGGMSENAYHVIQIDGTVASEPILDSLFIVSGNADNADVNKYGAGIIVMNTPASSGQIAKISECTFISNNASYGGAIATYESNDRLFLDRVIIRNNNASYGGAIYNNGSVLLSNSLIVGNLASAAGAIYCDSNSSTTITNATITQNRANYIGGLVVRGYGVATNNIFWGNTDVNGENEQIAIYSTDKWINYNCVQNIDSNFGGTGNISENPMFKAELGNDGEPGTGDEVFQLLPLSPCIDRGDNSAVTNFLDLIGNNRIVDDPYAQDGSGAIVDMGAFERMYNLDAISIWTGANSSSLTDPENWLPASSPTSATTMFFHSTTTNVFAQIDDQLNVNDLIVTAGNVLIDLGANAIQFNSPVNPLQVGGSDNYASLLLRGVDSSIYTKNTPTELYKGHIEFDGISLYTPNLTIKDGSLLGFNGTTYSDLTNVGGVVETAGRAIGSFTIDGDLINMGKHGPTGNLVGSLGFDIKGTTPEIDHDLLNVVGEADMSCLIDLRWNSTFTPTVGDTFDIMTVGTSSGSPSIVYSDGLPPNLAIRWVNPTGLRVGEEIIIETTGPILFGTSALHDLSSSTAPTDMVVGDFNGDSEPDIAMTVQNIGGENGSVVILINNGMSGDTWLGFTESAPISVGISPMDIEIGDFNVDGSANDLVIANNGSDTVSILSNDNSGIFTKTDVSTDVGPMHIAVGDYAEEADPIIRDDIFVACSSYSGSMLTNASTFGTRSIAFSHTNSIGIPLAGDIEPGDVNHDKDLDFIILDTPSNEVRVLRGTGAGTTPPMVVTGNPLPSSSNPVELHFADFDLDGNSDAITVNEGNDTLSILLGSNTELGNASTFSVGTSPTSLVTYDFDNDGDVDIVVSAINESTIIRELTLIRNDTPSPGGTVVLSAGDATGTGDTPVSVEHGDFNGDGLEDLAALIDQGASGPGVGIYFNSTAVVVNCPEDINNDGTVAVGDILAIISAWGTNTASADVNNDGVVDVSDLLAVVAAWGPCP